MLELCSKRYSTPVLTGPALTVFIGRKVRGVTMSLARLDIVVRHGRAYTSIVRSDAPRVDLEPVLVDSDDDVVSIAIKVLESAQ